MTDAQYDRLNCAECGTDVGAIQSPPENDLGTDGADVVVSQNEGAARVLCPKHADEKMGDRDA